MTEGRIVDLQRDVVAGLLAGALPGGTDFRADRWPIVVGAEMDAEVRRILGVGIVSRHEHKLGVDGERADAACVAALGAAELTDQGHGFLLRFAADKVMGVPSPRRRAPDEAAIAVLVGVERGGPADHRAGGKRAEVTAIQAVADFPVHEEQLAVRDHAAALPYPQWSPATVVIERVSHRDTIDDDRVARPADTLPRERGDVFQKWDATRQISAIGKECGEGLGGFHRDQIGQVEWPGSAYRVEADRSACRRIPDELRRE